jgi:hypothetical protein
VKASARSPLFVGAKTFSIAGSKSSNVPVVSVTVTRINADPHFLSGVLNQND